MHKFRFAQNTANPTVKSLGSLYKSGSESEARSRGKGVIARALGDEALPHFPPWAEGPKGLSVWVLLHARITNAKIFSTQA